MPASKDHQESNGSLPPNKPLGQSQGSSSPTPTPNQSIEAKNVSSKTTGDEVESSNHVIEVNRASSKTTGDEAESSDDDDSSIGRDLEFERAQPWPASFERSVVLLAGPHLRADRDVDWMTRSPMKSVTPRVKSWRKAKQASQLLDVQKLTRRHTINYDSHSYRDQRTSSLQDAKMFLKSIYASPAELDTLLKFREEGHRIGAAGTDVAVYSPGMEREQQIDQLQEEHHMAWEGKASFAQCILNMVNILLGLGILGLPYVLKSAGWIGGLSILVAFAAVTWRTAILIGRSLNGDNRPLREFDTPFLTPHKTLRCKKPIKSFPEIASHSFGNGGNILLSTVLYFELFSCLAISLVTMAEHMNVIFPSLSIRANKIVMAAALTLPTALLRTPRLISYLSAVGICAAIVVVLSVISSALQQGDVTSLILAPEEGHVTSTTGNAETPFRILWNGSGIPMSLGLSAYTFSGHATVPSIFVSMREPRKFERMITISWAIVLCCCLTVACSGYYMFGLLVHDQITISLASIPAFAEGTAIKMLTALMVLTAFSTFTLCMYPLAIDVEELVAPMIEDSLKVVTSHSIRFSLITLALAVAVFVPSFSFICTLVGLVTTMTVSVIFPCAAYVRLFGPKLTRVDIGVNYFLASFGILSAVVGTYALVGRSLRGV